MCLAIYKHYYKTEMFIEQEAFIELSQLALRNCRAFFEIMMQSRKVRVRTDK